MMFHSLQGDSNISQRSCFASREHVHQAEDGPVEVTVPAGIFVLNIVAHGKVATGSALIFIPAK
jgi:hypothetical protein